MEFTQPEVKRLYDSYRDACVNIERQKCGEEFFEDEDEPGKNFGKAIEEIIRANIRNFEYKILLNTIIRWHEVRGDSIEVAINVASTPMQAALVALARYHLTADNQGIDSLDVARRTIQRQQT